MATERLCEPETEAAPSSPAAADGSECEAVPEKESLGHEAEVEEAVDMRSGHCESAKPATGEAPTEGALVARQRFEDLYGSGNELIGKRSVQAAAAGAVVGGAIVGAGGAATGLTAGGALGFGVGVVAAPISFGLSIPVATTVGASTGLLVGSAAGGIAGVIGGSTVGYRGYQHREQIRAVSQTAQLKISQCANSMATVLTTRGARVAECVQGALLHSSDVLGEAAEKAKDFGNSSCETARSKPVQATLAGATGGALVLGTGGAAAGTAMGGFFGAGVGLLGAPLTLGLSIPFCAVVGGGAGLAVGSAAGGTTGLICGSAVGYGLFTKSDDISAAYAAVQGKITDSLDSLAMRLQTTTPDSSPNDTIDWSEVLQSEEFAMVSGQPVLGALTAENIRLAAILSA